MNTTNHCVVRHMSVCFFAAFAFAQDPATTERIQALEKEVKTLRVDLDAERALRDRREQELVASLESANAASAKGSGAWSRFTLGGYGEITYVDEEGPRGSVFDLRRFVVYLGYRFDDRLRLHSETEFQHGLVGEDGEGELEMEQLYVEWDASPGITVKGGRFLTPLGIVNRRHEPTAFNGVERSDFDRFILPSTWSADGIGVAASPCETIDAELNLQAGLDGTGFDAVEGIREGRQEQLASFSEPALSGRVDWRAFNDAEASLRAGLSAFVGGLDNGADGEDPGIDADIRIYSADLEASIARFDFKAQYALEDIGGAAEIGANVAEQIDGWLIEGALHVLPGAWRNGSLEDADAIVFARYEELDTQKELPDGVTPDPRGRRDIWTFGIGFLPTRNFVVKADYQVRDDDAVGLPERFSLGLGWSF